MMQSRNALGNLVARYMAVLGKCRMINALSECPIRALAAMTVVGVAVAGAVPTEARGAGLDEPPSIVKLHKNIRSWESQGHITEKDYSGAGGGSYCGVLATTGPDLVSMELKSGHTLTVKGSAEDAYLTLKGIDSRRGNTELVNNGAIIVETESVGTRYDVGVFLNASADTYGIMTGSIADIRNTGTIDVTSTVKIGGTLTTAEAALNAKACGIASSKAAINNSGTINVTATSQKSVPIGDAHARGMSGTGGKAITNEKSGAITVRAESGGGAHALGIEGSNGNTINNHGTVSVTAHSIEDEAVAYGIKVYDAGASYATVNNYGTLDVKASSENGSSSAYQLYTRNTRVNVNTWTLKLGETYGSAGKGYYVFGTSGTGLIVFDNGGGDGANFIISGIGDAFVDGKEYKISDMIDGAAEGFIGSVTSTYDFVTLELIGEDSYKNQYIKGSLEVTEEVSPTQGAARQTLVGIMGHMHHLGKVLDGEREVGGAKGTDMAAKGDTANMYADASTTFTDAGGSYVDASSPLWKTFLMPFYSVTSENNGAYDTSMGGVVLGASRKFGDALDFGLHASVAKAKSDSTYTDSDALSYALGLHGVYTLDESLYVRGQLTGFFVENDMQMRSSTGAAQKASAAMDSYGVYAELAAGYDWMLAPAHILTPELGLSYMYAHMGGFNSTFVGGGAPTSFSMASENYDVLYADASLRWTGTFALGGTENSGRNGGGNSGEWGQLKPTVKAGVRHALTDAEIRSTMNIFGASATTYSDANERAFMCEAGLSWLMDDITLSATYSGEFGNVEHSHMGMFKAEWKF